MCFGSRIGRSGTSRPFEPPQNTSRSSYIVCGFRKNPLSAIAAPANAAAM